VYRGSWHKRPAAIKVMNMRNSDSDAVSDAMEMAVLSSVQHPNIVQVYSCLTDMVEAPAGAPPPHVRCAASAHARSCTRMASCTSNACLCIIMMSVAAACCRLPIVVPSTWCLVELSPPLLCPPSSSPLAPAGVESSSQSFSSGASASAGLGQRGLQYRRMLPEDDDGPTYSIIVMEYCDR
jgi:hypothetical protein